MVGTFPRLVPQCSIVPWGGRNLLSCDETVLSPRGDGNHLLVQIFPMGGEKNLRRWLRHALRGEVILVVSRMFPGPGENIGPVISCGVATMSSI